MRLIVIRRHTELSRINTNIRLRWSREEMECMRGLQTFGSAGAGRGNGMHACYKHSAPLEPGEEMECMCANIRLCWSREETECVRGLQTFGSAGAGGA